MPRIVITFIMASTVIITGANGSAAIHAVSYLLKHYAEKHLVLTVRNTSDSDVNTQQLKTVIADYPKARFTIHALDLSSLSAVEDFAKAVASEVASSKLPPLESIICNAFYWNLTSEKETTSDGFEKTFQVNHIAHSSLVLRLLSSFSPDGGRVILFTSDAHWPGKNSLEKIPPAIPSDLNQLAKPPPGDPTEDHMAKGFNRYAVSKLTVLMWAYALNTYLEKVCHLNHP